MAVCDTMKTDMDNYQGVIGYNKEGGEIMEDAVADVRLTIYKALKGLKFGGSGGGDFDDDDFDDGFDDNDDDDFNDNGGGCEEETHRRAVVMPFAFK